MQTPSIPFGIGLEILMPDGEKKIIFEKWVTGVPELSHYLEEWYNVELSSSTLYRIKPLQAVLYKANEKLPFDDHPDCNRAVERHVIIERWKYKLDGIGW